VVRQHPTSHRGGWEAIIRGRGQSNAAARRSPASGDAVDRVSQHDRDEIKAQAAQREQQKRRIDSQVKAEGHECWYQLHRWVDRCPICHVRNCSGQAVDARHTLDECGDEQQTAVVAQVKVLQGMNFERFACCTRCAVRFVRICRRSRRAGSGLERRVP
jgi:hypothetical protein